MPAARSLLDVLTRRYHALLVAPVEPPLGRRNLSVLHALLIRNANGLP